MSNIHNLDAYLQSIDKLITNMNNLDESNKNNLMNLLNDIDNKIDEFDKLTTNLPKLQRNIISEFP